MGEKAPFQPLASRQWSSESLQRGLSFLKDQNEKEKLEYGDILAAPSQKCFVKSGLLYNIYIYYCNI